MLLISSLVAAILIVAVVFWAFLLYNGRYAAVIIVGLISRILLILMQEKFGIFGNLDIIDYERYFVAFENSLNNSDLWRFFGVHVPAYTLMYPGWLFSIFHEDGYWLIRLCNSICGLLVLAPLIWLYHQVFREAPKSYQLLLITLWPTWLRYNVELGRTAPSVLLTITGLAASLALFKRPSISLISGWFGSVVAAIVLRTHYIIFFFSAIAVYTYMLTFKLRSQVARIFVSIALLFGLAALTWLTFDIYQNVTSTIFSIESFDDIVNLAERRDQGNSAYLSGIVPSSILDWVWYLPLQAFYFLFSPMIWDVNGVFLLGSSLQALLSLFLILNYFNNNIGTIRQNPLLKLLLLSLLISTLAFGAVTKNAGGAERWRLPITLILLSVTTQGLFSKDQHKIQSQYNLRKLNSK